MNITDQELQIFSRQLILNEFKEKNFDKLQKKHIIIIGMGGIGCPLSQYLIASGIKKLTIIDHDKIDITNLNRQILFSFNDIGKNKADIAKIKLSKINPNCFIRSISKKITKLNIDTYIKEPSIIIDSTDNWISMNLINEYCVKNSIPLISSSVIGFDGQVMFFKNDKSNHLCLNCIYPITNEPDLPRCDTVGVMGTAAGFTGLMAAQSIINYLIDKKNSKEILLMINAKTMKINHIKLKKNKKCRNFNE